MKNIIAYYYNLYSYDIHQYKDSYKFTILNDKYALVPCDIMELKKINNIITALNSNKIYMHQIILTKSNSQYITHNNRNYILLKYQNGMDKKIEFSDILNFNRNMSLENFSKLEKNNWAVLWSNKIDYFEYQVNQLGKKYPKIRESISYYIGMVETGISLYNNTNRLMGNITSISHKRIGKNSTLYDLYNPLNFIIDYRIRDAAEYFKDLFVENENIFENILNYFYKEHLTMYECYSFFVRLFYPSFYFDAYERVINNEIEDSKLQIIIDKTSSYERLLKQLYYYLSNYMEMPDIEWIKKI